MNESVEPLSLSAKNTKDAPARARRLPLVLVLAGVALILFWLTLKTYRVVRIAQALLAREAQARALVEQGFTDIDAGEAERLVLATHTDIVRLKRETAPFLGVLAQLDWVPRVGPLFRAAPHLLSMAEGGSEAAGYAIRGLGPALSAMQSQDQTGSARISNAIAGISAARPDLVLALRSLEQVKQARNQISDPEKLPWRVRTLLEQFDAWLPLAYDGLILAPILPELAGYDSRKSYLVMAQNEDELRPTGGFISGAGLAVIEQGRILSISFDDANTVDDWRNKPYDFPPEPLRDFMGSELFLFRDANFWPDFPTSAERAMQLYTYGQEVHLDGVIALDQEFVRMLLSEVGPLLVPDLERTVNSENVIAELRDAWAPGDADVAEWLSQRKSFMGPLAEAFRLKIERELGSLDVVALARMLQTAVEQRHLQIHMRDPTVASLLEQIGWDGSQRNSAGQDFLLAVDTNVGFNKTNAAMSRALRYQVVLEEDGGGLANLYVDYEHGSAAAVGACQHATMYRAGIKYDELVDDCYWNYLRIYLPAGSRLLRSSKHPIEPKNFITGRGWDGEAQYFQDEKVGLTVYANLLLVPVGQRVTSSFTYELPNTIVHDTPDGHHYRLRVNKQAGTGAQSLEVTITLPAGSELVEATPEPSSISGRELTFEAHLATDLSFDVLYRESAP